MSFNPFPWKNKGEPSPTKINKQNLNAAEEAIATAIGNGEVALPSSVVSRSAVPSGVASTDTVNVQAALNALSEAAGASNVATALFSSATPFQINAPLYKPWNVNIEGNATFKAVEGFPAESTLLQDSAPTTVAAESNGGNTTSIASWSSPSAGVLKVASTTGYPSKGQIRVANASGTAIVNYTGTTETSFTGCTLAGGTGGIVSTGGKISARTYNGVISAGITLDSNNIARNGLYLHFFAGMDIGCMVRNSLGDDVILGDSAAVSSSYGPALLSQFFVDRTAGAMPAGKRCLWIMAACSDGTLAKGVVLKGQKTGIQCDGSDWTIDTPHAWSEGMETCFYDNGLHNKWTTPIADTPTTYGLLLGASQNYGTYVGLFVENNSIYGTDNEMIAVHNAGSGQKNVFIGTTLQGGGESHRIAHDYTGDRSAMTWLGATWENVVAISVGANFLTGNTSNGGVGLVLQVDRETINSALQVYSASQGEKLLEIDKHGLIHAPSLILPPGLLKPTAAQFETMSRSANMASGAMLTTEVLSLAAIALPAGVSLSQLAFVSGNTAAGTPTNWWFVLCDLNRKVLAVTADQTNTAWGTFALKQLAIAKTWSGSEYASAASWTTTYTGLYYIGIMVKATTVPTLTVASPGTAVPGLTPVLYGNSTTGQTTPPSGSSQFTGAAITAVNAAPYAYVG